MAQNGYDRHVEACYSGSREDQRSWRKWGRGNHQISQWYLKIINIVVRSQSNESFLKAMSLKSYLFVFRHWIVLFTPHIQFPMKWICMLCSLSAQVGFYIDRIPHGCCNILFESISSGPVFWSQFPLWQDCEIELYRAVMWPISATTT